MRRIFITLSLAAAAFAGRTVSAQSPWLRTNPASSRAILSPQSNTNARGKWGYGGLQGSSGNGTYQGSNQQRRNDGDADDNGRQNGRNGRGKAKGKHKHGKNGNNGNGSYQNGSYRNGASRDNDGDQDDRGYQNGDYPNGTNQNGRYGNGSGRSSNGRVTTQQNACVDRNGDGWCDNTSTQQRAPGRSFPSSVIGVLGGTRR